MSEHGLRAASIRPLFIGFFAMARPKQVPDTPSSPVPKAAGKRKATPAAVPKLKAPKTSNELAALKSSKAALRNVDAADLAAVKVADVKRLLNAYVKSLAHTVDRDWHDSWEETGQEVCEWFEKSGDAIEAAMKVGVGHGVAIDQCHEVLKIVADTWSNINTIPFRRDVGEEISDVDADIEVDLGGNESGTFHLTTPERLVALAWPILLARAAADKGVPDTALLRMIKDAVDHGVSAPHIASEEETALEAEAEDEGTLIGDELVLGRARLGELFTGRKAEWSALTSTKKKHKMRRLIDRRYDGPKHLRTRDFGDSDEEGCVVQ